MGVERKNVQLGGVELKLVSTPPLPPYRNLALSENYGLTEYELAIVIPA